MKKFFLILNLLFVFGCADFDVSQAGEDSETYAYDSRQDNTNNVRLPFFINNQWSLVELSRSAQQPSVVWADQLQVSLATRENTRSFNRGLNKITYRGEDFYLRLTSCPTVGFRANIADMSNGTLGLLDDGGTMRNDFSCEEESPKKETLLNFPYIYIGNKQEEQDFSFSLAMDSSLQKGLFALERFSGDYFTSQTGSWESVQTEGNDSVLLGNSYYFRLPRKLASYRLRIVAADVFEQFPQEPFTYYFYTVTEEDRQSVRLDFKDTLYLLSEVETLGNGRGKRIPQNQLVNKTLEQRFSHGDNLQILTRMDLRGELQVRAYQELSDGAGIFSNTIAPDVMKEAEGSPQLSENNLYRHIWQFLPEKRERYLMTVDYTTGLNTQQSFGLVVPEDSIPRWTKIERLSRDRTVELLQETRNFPTDRNLTGSNYSKLEETTGSRNSQDCSVDEEVGCVLNLTPHSSILQQRVDVQAKIKKVQDESNYYAGLRLWIKDPKGIKDEEIELILKEIKRGEETLTATTQAGRETYWVTEVGEQSYEGDAALRYIDVALFINNEFPAGISLELEAKDRFSRELKKSGETTLSLRLSSSS